MAKKRKLTDIEQEYVDSINPVSPNPNALPALENEFLPYLGNQSVFGQYNPQPQVMQAQEPQPSAMDGIAGGLSAIRNNGIGNSIRSGARSLADQINEVVQPTRDAINEGNALRRQAAQSPIVPQQTPSIMGGADAANFTSQRPLPDAPVAPPAPTASNVPGADDPVAAQQYRQGVADFRQHRAENPQYAEGNLLAQATVEGAGMVNRARQFIRGVQPAVGVGAGIVGDRITDAGVNAAIRAAQGINDIQNAAKAARVGFDVGAGVVGDRITDAGVNAAIKAAQGINDIQAGISTAQQAVPGITTALGIGADIDQGAIANTVGAGRAGLQAELSSIRPEDSVAPAIDENPMTPRPDYTQAIAGGEQDISQAATEARKQRIMDETGMSEAEYEQVRKQNLEDRRAYNTAKAQTMNQLRSLAAQARDLDRAGDAQAAGQVRAQIAELRQALDAEGRRIGSIAQSMRGRISDLSPSEQVAAVERGRASLNAQLPTIARSAQEQADAAAAEQTSRLSDIGRKAFQLENGNLSDFAGMSDAAFAQYAQEQASPEAIMQATRGVGLPTSAAPGSQAFADRVGGLSSIDFGPLTVRSPSAITEIDANRLNDALSISNNAREARQDTLETSSSSNDTTKVVRDYLRQFPEAAGNPLIQSVSSGVVKDTIRNAVSESNPSNIDLVATTINEIASDPKINNELRKAIARDIAEQIKEGYAQMVGNQPINPRSFGAAMKGLGVLTRGITGKSTEMDGAIKRLMDAAKALDPSITFDT
jgi:hypothetical protein